MDDTALTSETFDMTVNFQPCECELSITGLETEYKYLVGNDSV